MLVLIEDVDKYIQQEKKQTTILLRQQQQEKFKKLNQQRKHLKLQLQVRTVT